MLHASTLRSLMINWRGNGKHADPVIYFDDLTEPLFCRNDDFGERKSQSFHINAKVLVLKLG